MEERLVQTRHGKVAVVDYGGEGPDVLLLHGSTRTLADFAQIRPRVKDRRIVAMDFRYHGFSSDEGEIGLEAFADDAEAVVADLRLQNPAVAGHSLGGMVAAVYGSRHPECPGVANFDGHGIGTLEQYDGISRERFERYLADAADLHRAGAAAAWSGDDAWREAFIAAIKQQAVAYGVPAEILDEVLSRGLVKDEHGVWHRRPANPYWAQSMERFRSLRMFETYRACECPLLIYNCVLFDPDPIPDAEEIMAAYRRGLGRDLAELAADKPNIRIRTLQTGHGMLGEETQVSADILSLNA